MKAFQKTGVGFRRMIRQENSSFITPIGYEKLFLKRIAASSAAVGRRNLPIFNSVAIPHFR
jgi:hypothetical protein